MGRRCGMIAVLLGMAAFLAGCRSSITGTNNDFEYQQDFTFNKSVAGIGAISVSNVNGTIAITGKDGLTEVQITGVKTVKAGSYDAAKNYVGDIKIDTATSQDGFGVTTVQPNSLNGPTYEVDYEITVPKQWETAITNVNGTVDVFEVNGGVVVHLTNGMFDAEGINGNVAASLTNGNISGRVVLPDSGTCELRTLNGNVYLAIPDSTSATLSTSVVNGSVSVSNLPVVTASNTLTSFTGTIGSGSGSIVLSTVNGVIQLTSM